MADILIVDDAIEEVRRSLDLLLAQYKRHYAASGPQALTLLERHPEIGLVFLDINMPAHFSPSNEWEGLAVLDQMRSQFPHVPVVMLSVYDDAPRIVAAMKKGAFHYLTKPPDRTEMLSVIQQAMDTDTPATEMHGFDDLVGSSEAMRRVFEQIGQLAPTNATVLIQGESGTGKEIVARALWKRSKRASGPFVPVNCAAIPSDLLESTLFGHVRGAFTGADRTTRGLFEQADKGTLFLDEIGDMSLDLQSKLLRVLENPVVRPIGAQHETEVDVRILSATHRPLLELAQQGKFREDLFYRLNVLVLRLPPLRERMEDLPLLARHLLARQAQKNGVPIKPLSEAALARLRSHTWPGNVRELANVLAGALLLSSGPQIGPDDIRFETPVSRAGAAPASFHPNPMEAADPLWQQITRGTLKIADFTDFRNRYGENTLREVLARAIRQVRDYTAAARLLGYIEGHEAPSDLRKKQDNFRSWVNRLGMSKRDILHGS